jgi:dual specificity MAP kinase phosphatase
VTDIDDFETFEAQYPHLVAIDSCGRTTEHKLDFMNQEREEMRRLTTATKISENVYLGNSADAFNTIGEYINADGKVTSKGFDVCIEAKDMAEVASTATLKEAETFLNGDDIGEPPTNRWYARSLTRPLSLEFPSSGMVKYPNPPFMTRHDPEAIVSFCEWIYHLSHSSAEDVTDDADTPEDVMTDIEITPTQGRSILIHCQDGYTESTFLALAYLVFAEGITAHEAWVKLHTDLQRSFFAFDSDLQTLKYLQSYLLSRSPAATSFSRISTPTTPPAWFTHVTFDGSFPSRILPHMYLGNLQHANNPEMLRAIGITRVLSIGEQVIWDMDKETSSGMQIMYLDNVQDNGIDPLLDYIDQCLEFLGTPLPHKPNVV